MCIVKKLTFAFQCRELKGFGQAGATLLTALYRLWNLLRIGGTEQEKKGTG